MPNQNTVWVTGAKGFIGSVICQRFEKAGLTVVGTDTELSVCEPERLEIFAREVQPGFIVNCAGIRRDATGLGNRIKAYEVNALGARNMAIAANTVGATIVQVSSDDVYDLSQVDPVNEFDSPHPTTPYGKSKRAGEVMVRDITPDHVIIRSSWVYHAQGGQLKAMLDAAAAGEKYEARTDQVAAPTSINLYVEFLLKAIKHGAKGTYHIASKGSTSRYGFAQKALELAGYNPDDVLIATEDAKTVENLVLESMMLEMYGADLPTWEEDLANYLKAVGIAK